MQPFTVLMNCIMLLKQKHAEYRSPVSCMCTLLLVWPALPNLVFMVGEYLLRLTFYFKLSFHMPAKFLFLFFAVMSFEGRTMILSL